MLKMKMQFEYHDNYFEVNRNLWNFGCDESFQGTYFGHALFKACQYAIVGEKVSRGLKCVFVKYD
jgi:hypothetical protein